MSFINPPKEDNFQSKRWSFGVHVCRSPDSYVYVFGKPGSTQRDILASAKVMKLNTGNWKVRGVYSHLHLLEYVNAEPPNLQCPGYFPKWPEKSGCEMVVNCPH